MYKYIQTQYILPVAKIFIKNVTIKASLNFALHSPRLSNKTPVSDNPKR